MQLSKLVFRTSEILSVVKRKHAQKIKFSIKDFFSKFDQIRSHLVTFSHGLVTFTKEILHFLFSGTCLKSVKNKLIESSILFWADQRKRYLQKSFNCANLDKLF